MSDLMTGKKEGMSPWTILAIIAVGMLLVFLLAFKNKTPNTNRYDALITECESEVQEHQKEMCPKLVMMRLNMEGKDTGG